MNAKSPTLYQNGVIDVFKLFKVFDLNIVQVNSCGEVSCVMDSEIGRKIIKVTGNLSASNFIEIPNKAYTKSLNYLGKYYYFFFKAFADKKFTFQLTFIVSNQNLLRFTFKYPLKEMKISRTNAYNVEIPIPMDDNNSGFWTIFKFDPVDFVNSNLLQCKDFASLSGMTPENTVLRTVHMWSTIYIRGLYISNGSFTLNTLPKEMQVKVQDQSHPFNNIQFIDLCTETKEQIKELEPEDKYEDLLRSSQVKDKFKMKKKEMDEFSSSIAEIEKKTKDLKNENMKRHKENLVDATIKKLQKTQGKSLNDSDINKLTAEMQSNLDLKESNNETLLKNVKQ